MYDGQHRWVVDAIEEQTASVEVDGKDLISLPRWLIPDGARSGDVLSVLHDRPPKGRRSMLTITVDAAATMNALAESANQVKRAKQSSAKDPGGDIDLS